MFRCSGHGALSPSSLQRLGHVSGQQGFGTRSDSPEGTMMMTSRMMMPTMRHMRIFMSFHHICLRTLLAPRRKPCADWARLSVLFWRESRRSSRALSCRTFLSISWMAPLISWRRVSTSVFTAEIRSRHTAWMASLRWLPGCWAFAPPPLAGM